MKAPVHTWLADRWASRNSAYWRALPMRSMGRLLAAAFILSGGVGFAIDLLLLNYQPLARGFFWPVYSGTLGTATLAARIKRLGLVPVLLLMTLAGLWLGVRISFHSPASPDVEALHRRAVFDAIGILAEKRTRGRPRHQRGSKNGFFSRHAQPAATLLANRRSLSRIGGRLHVA